MSNKNLMIRSSSAEFLIFENQKKGQGIQVRFENGDLWLTQKSIASLYDTDRTVITKHLKNIYESLELDKSSTSAIFALVQEEGKRKVAREINYYNLDAVISVGFRVNYDRAIQDKKFKSDFDKFLMETKMILNKNIRLKIWCFLNLKYYL